MSERFTSNVSEQIHVPRTKFRKHESVIKDIDVFLEKLRRISDTGLHIGAGTSKIQNLTNCDLYNPDADLKLDATNLYKFENCTVDLIESHHMIEHLSFQETHKAIAEWQRVLRKNGLLILTFPDITAVCMQWLKYSLLYPIFPRPKRLDYIVKMMMGSQEHEGMFHKNAFDFRRMSRTLSNQNFNIEFTYYPYPKRPTPSRLIIARKN
jgi:predicted SAM-dependent methyltransferase